MRTHTDTQGLGPYILSASARRGDIRLDERFPGIIDIIGLFAKRNSPAFPLLSLSLPADTHRWLVDEADPLEILSLYKGLIRSCERASARALLLVFVVFLSVYPPRLSFSLLPLASSFFHVAAVLLFLLPLLLPI